MASDTASNIIAKALTKAGIFHPGESIPAGIQTQVFDGLNDMLERWALERLLVHADVIESFSLVAGQSEYEYGTGGDFDSLRPDDIMDCFIRVGSTDYEVIIKSVHLYREMGVKSTELRPKFMAYNPGYPLLTVFLWPTPASAYQIHFMVRKQLIKFADQTTSVDLPPGFRGGLVSNLAVEIAGDFGKKLSAETALQADRFIKSIKRSNKTMSKGMKTDLRWVIN